MQISLFRSLHQATSPRRNRHISFSRDLNMLVFKYCYFDTFSNYCTTLVVYGYRMGAGYVNLSVLEPIGLLSISQEQRMRG